MSAPSMPTIMLFIDGVWINALEVEVVKSDYVNASISITLKSGRVVVVGPKMRNGVAAMEEKLVRDIDHALLTIHGVVPFTETKFKPSGG